MPLRALSGRQALGRMDDERGFVEIPKLGNGSAPLLSLSFATWDHDRVMAIHDRRVTIPGVTLESHIGPTSRLFPLAVQEARYDITELSVSSYLLQVARGDSAYTAVPAFISRAFRHSGFMARRGSGIETPSHFAGRRVGVPEYQMTAALWMRGILLDEYGVGCEEIQWRTGALDAGVRHERLPLELPDDMIVKPIAEGKTLQDLLLEGEIDALLAPKPPKAFLEGHPDIVRLFPDFETAERAYHRKTGFFPIMHLLAVRNSVAEAQPWLPAAIYEAALSARDLAMARLRDIWLGNSNRLTLPWLNATMERTIATLGNDYWPYGFARNRHELEAICRYSVQQHLAPRLVAPEELFHASVLDT